MWVAGADSAPATPLCQLHCLFFARIVDSWPRRRRTMIAGKRSRAEGDDRAAGPWRWQGLASPVKWQGDGAVPAGGRRPSQSPNAGERPVRRPNSSTRFCPGSGHLFAQGTAIIVAPVGWSARGAALAGLRHFEEMVGGSWVRTSLEMG